MIQRFMVVIIMAVEGLGKAIKNFTGNYVTYEEAKLFIRARGITSLNQWRNYVRKNGRQPVPAGVNSYYKEHYNHADFFQPPERVKRVFMSYDEAKEFMLANHIPSLRQWRLWCTNKDNIIPDNLPKAPEVHYKEYKAYEFFGSTPPLPTVRRKVDYIQFEEVVKFVQSLKLENYRQWLTWCETNNPPEGIPHALKHVYGGEHDFDLLFPAKGKTQFVPYHEARKYCRRLGISSYRDWTTWIKTNELPDTIPRAPHRAYGAQFSIMDYFDSAHWKHEKEKQKRREIQEHDAILGVDKAVASGYLPYNQAKAFVQTFGFTSVKQYNDWLKKAGPEHPEIPVRPTVTYREKWNGWAEFIGVNFKEGHYTDHGFCSYVEAKQFVQVLRLKSREEWKQWCRSNRDTRLDIPRLPQKAYKEYWEGWEKFLGTNIVDAITVRQTAGQALFIAHETGTPSNVFVINVEPAGPTAVYEDVFIRRRGTLFKLYGFQNHMNGGFSTQDIIARIIRKNATPYLGEESGLWLVRNIHQLVWDLSDVCDEIPIDIPKYITYKLIEEKRRDLGLITEVDGAMFGKIFDDM